MTELEIEYDILDTLSCRECCLTAHEAAEEYDIKVQKASTILRRLESEKQLESKKIHAGMNDVKIYYLAR